MLHLQNIKIDDRAEKYLPSPGLISALEVAYMLKRPLLLTGEPGTGKTQFAFWVADHLSRTQGFQPAPYIYNTKTSSNSQDLFYHYDAIAHFRENQTGTAGSGGGSGKRTEDFIQLKALGLAIANAIGKKDLSLPASILERSKVSDGPTGSVVLIDEIDKASRDFPNDLLNEIENYEFEIKEINDNIKLRLDEHKQRIIVILTSNFEKNLPDAFLRRCIYYHIDFPTKDRLFEIILRRLDIHADDYDHLQKRVQDFLIFHHYPNIAKRPSTSEFIDWIRVLKNDDLLKRNFFVDGQAIIDGTLAKYLPILLKNKEDIGKFLPR